MQKTKYIDWNWNKESSSMDSFFLFMLLIIRSSSKVMGLKGPLRFLVGSKHLPLKVVQIQFKHISFSQK
jgi:hypothetical protein